MIRSAFRVLLCGAFVLGPRVGTAATIAFDGSSFPWGPLTLQTPPCLATATPGNPVPGVLGCSVSLEAPVEVGPISCTAFRYTWVGGNLRSVVCDALADPAAIRHALRATFGHRPRGAAHWAASEGVSVSLLFHDRHQPGMVLWLEESLPR